MGKWESERPPYEEGKIISGGGKAEIPDEDWDRAVGKRQRPTHFCADGNTERPGTVKTCPRCSLQALQFLCNQHWEKLHVQRTREKLREEFRPREDDEVSNPADTKCSGGGVERPEPNTLDPGEGWGLGSDTCQVREGDNEVRRNRARCRKCGTVVESHHTHDYVECACGSIAVDGDKRCGFTENIEEMP